MSRAFRRLRRVAASAAIAIAAAGTAEAATFTVDTLADDVTADGQCSLREAVAAHDAAIGSNDCGSFDAADDTVTFTVTGTIALDPLLGELVLTAPAVTIDGPGAGLLTLDGQDAMSVLVLDPAVPPALTVRELTIANGLARATGASSRGGAIRGTLEPFGVPTTITVEDAALIDNEAPGDSGHIGSGGAISSLGALVIRRTLLARNAAQRSAVHAVGNATIEDCEFVDNVGTAGAGAIGAQPVTVSLPFAWTIRRSLFRGNTGGQFGGSAVDFASAGAGSSLVVENSTFHGNSGGTGAVIFVRQQNVDGAVRNSTFAGNLKTVGPAGGVVTLEADSFAEVGTLHVESSLFASNAQPALRDAGAPAGSLTAAFNLFDTAAASLPAGIVCAGSTAGGANLCGVAAPGLDPLASNGGPTQTMALQPSSPAVDAGSNSGALATDQRGAGFARTVGAATDIGAFELQGAAGCVPNVVQFASATYSVTEGTPVATITVIRTGDCAGSIVYTTDLDGDANPPEDYTTTTGTLILPAVGPSSFTFTVPIVDDAEVEPTETLVLLLHSPDADTSIGAQDFAVLEIADNDSAAAPIPTLGEWGAGLLALLLAGFAVRRLT